MLLLRHKANDPTKVYYLHLHLLLLCLKIHNVILQAEMML